MAAIDPVSCLLCLDAFERPTMLRIHLRPIGGGDPHEYYLCQRCGGAIAAEYLYIQNSGKTDRVDVLVESTKPGPGPGGGELVEVDELGRHIPIETSTAKPSGEAETIAATGESAVNPRKSKR